MTVVYNRVALIGLGLIASSMFWSIRRGNLAKEVVGFAKSKKTRDTAKSIGLCDHVFDNLKDTVNDADLVVLCTPVGVMREVVEQIIPYLKKGATLSDVGSVKRAVLDAVEPLIPQDVHFVPAHPLAGTEHSGPESGFSSLFENRWCILVPTVSSTPKAVEKLTCLWTGMGALVDQMDADHHDLVLAVTSHTPHLIAYTMVGVADDLSRVTDKEVINYSAAGFRDFTRIASSDPTMWRDIILYNNKSILKMLSLFKKDLLRLEIAIKKDDGKFLLDLFSKTRKVRKDITQ